MLNLCYNKMITAPEAYDAAAVSARIRTKPAQGAYGKRRKNIMLGVYNYTVILTYIGMLTGLAGIGLAMRGGLPWALLCLLLAGLCDMFDGTIASTKKDRTPQEKRFGVQIDSLSDLICFGVLPAAIVFAADRGRIVAAVVSGLYALCALIRLAWFNVDEEERQDAAGGGRTLYLGLPVTTVALFLPTLLGVARLASWPLGALGAGLLAVMAVAFLLPFKLAKPGLAGKLVMLLIGCTELVVVLLGVKL